MLSIFNRKKFLVDLLPDNFIDIHSHLLPGIDDGAKNIEDSLQLIKELKNIGFQNLITTPHVLGDVWPNTSEIITKKKLELDEHLEAPFANAAAEYMLDQQFESLIEKDDLLTLKGSYILVEMSYFNAPIHLYEILFKLQLKGYIPVLAHPERYHFLHKNFGEYQKLKNAGCKFQLNLLSLSAHYGKDVQKTAFELLKQQQYDFIGSDVHNLKHISKIKELQVSKSHTNTLIQVFENNLLFN